MENNKIIQVVSSIFSGADERDWKKIHAAMSDTVLLDYSSMTGIAPSELTPEQITAAWAGFLPGFDRTHHKLSDFKVTMQDDFYKVHMNGTADHFIGTEVWTVKGNYDAVVNKNLRVTELKFNFQEQTGNLTLPARAQEAAKKSK